MIPAGNHQKRIDLSQIDSSTSVAYLLDKELNILYVNQAYLDFAYKNGAGPDFADRFGVGCKLKDILNPFLYEFYHEHYLEVLKTGNRWKHAYQCSSATTFRLFTQYALASKGRLLIVNRLMEEYEIPLAKLGKRACQPADYLSPAGYVTQCAHCRKVQKQRETYRWERVVEWVEKPPLKTRFTLCHQCFKEYYQLRAD